MLILNPLFQFYRVDIFQKIINRLFININHSQYCAVFWYSK